MIATEVTLLVVLLWGRRSNTSHKRNWPVSSPLRAWPVKNQVKDRPPRSRPGWDLKQCGRTMYLCSTTFPSRDSRKRKTCFLAIPIQILITPLQKLVLVTVQTLWKLGFKKNQISWPVPPRFWLGISGVGSRNLHLLEESSDLNGNYLQTSRHSLIGHSDPAFEPWSHCGADDSFRQRYLNCFLILQMVYVVYFSEGQD